MYSLKRTSSYTASAKTTPPWKMKTFWTAEDKPRWLRRRMNQAGLEIAYRLHRQRIPGVPRILMIEPTNLCNLHCPLCPTGNGALKRSRGLMDIALYRQILEELDGGLDRVMLYNYGEPFLHPHIFEMIALARQKEIHTRLSTNGLVFSLPGYADDLIASKLNVLRVSLDGASPETYQVYRAGGRLEPILHGIGELQQRKRQLGRSRPLVEIQFIVMRHNEHEIPVMRQLAQSFGTALRIKTVGLGDLGMQPERSQWLPADERLRRYTMKDGRYELADDHLRTWRCDHPWKRLVINWDGQITPCCYDRDGLYSFGNAWSGVRLTWNSSLIQAFRAALCSDSPPKLCRRCSARIWNTFRLATVEYPKLEL